MRLLIALGGNAMTAPDGAARPADQEQAISAAMEHVADLVVEGYEVVLTHGNGPQVGNLLVKNEIAASVVPPVPLDWCGAQTQGTIALLIMNALDAALASRNITARAAGLVSRTLIDSNDPGFSNPTKPIGRYLPAAEAEKLAEHGQVWQDRGERGWRRVVASPEPKEILEVEAIKTLIASGFLVVASGGGGIPVVRDAAGVLKGVEAVLDKDLTAALLASQVAADVLVIATDVPNAVVDFGKPGARSIGKITPSEMRKLAAEGYFASGSMGPKVEAACRFAESGGITVITSLEQIRNAVSGVESARFDVGTVVVGS
ncbi:MAG TPA: carbamate kinase [Candidatus Nanopelagicaceae bacterium]|nr:carbamate kinase [Candidatus Nanopelagicaceae bacterium]